MKVSIIIPLYNKAPYVRRALDSIAAQTFADFETIVVDDGSTDDGPEIAAAYPDARLRLIRQDNSGPGAARNAGIAQARGEFLAFLDADDEWLPNYLAEGVRLLESSGPEVASVTCGYIEYPSGASTENVWRRRGITAGVHRIHLGTSPSLFVSMLAYMSPWSTLARAEVIRKWGGFYDREKCRYGEDATLWFKILLNETVAFNLQPLACFHREASGLSNNLNGSRPIEPFLKDASDIEAACPAELRDLASRVIAIRAAKTACVLGYWGHWREARSLMRQFTSAKNWRLPYHAPALVCSTPVGPLLGAAWRVVNNPLVSAPAHAVSRRPTSESKIKILAIVEATTVNALAKNVLEFQRVASELEQQSSDFPGIELSLVTFDRASSGSEARSDNEFVSAARELGVEIDIVQERRRFDLNVISALRQIVAQRVPDIVVTHSVKSHFLVLRSRLWRAFPWVAFHHGYTSTDRKMRLYNQFDRWSLPKADRVITVCEAFAQDLARTKGVARARVSVKHNSIRPQSSSVAEEARALREQLRIADDERIVLAVGRLSREKAHADLIEACNHLRATHPDLKAKFVIVGEGPERDNLEALAASLGISDRIIFTGHESDVRPYYEFADVLANSSHSEGSPYVLLEAMSIGLPIVATAVGGVPEMLKDEDSALLVPARNRQAMAAAIARLLSDEQLAKTLSKNATGLVATRFSPEAYVRSLTEIYREVIRGRARRGR